jgi:hypothetical protein
MKRLYQCLLTLVAVGGVLGCGSSSPPTMPTPQPTPTPAQPMLVTQGGATLPARHFRDTSFSTSQTGTLNVTVNWTFGTDLMWIGIAVPANCTIAAYQASSCSFVAFDQSLTATPTKILTLPNLGPGSYILLVDDRGPADESYSYQLTLTP